jgi:hypothetical protein
MRQFSWPLGDGAGCWLIEAAAVGARQIRGQMTEAVSLSRLYSRDLLAQALGEAAMVGLVNGHWYASLQRLMSPAIVGWAGRLRSG